MIFKPYELFYYENGNRLRTRNVENFRNEKERQARKEELERLYPNLVFPNMKGEPA